jgi:4-hydroxybenzoate polyprenyltransferase
LALANNPYLKLLRIPNIFTVPPDVILGFLIAQSLLYIVDSSFDTSNIPNLILLILSSIMLYLGGLVSNDLFDMKTDRIERPTRPLPSGRVQKKHAVVLLIVLFFAGFFLSTIINHVTAGISLLLIFLILIYNYKLKIGFSRPFTMGGIRALNVFYGFSILFGLHGQQINYSSFAGILPPSQLISSIDFQQSILLLLILVLFSIFFHIFVLSFVSSRETPKEFSSLAKKSNLNRLFYYYFTFLIVIGFLGYYLVQHSIAYLFFILALGISVGLIYHKAQQSEYNTSDGSLKMKFIVKNMLVLLILLDSAYIAGISGPIVGIATTASLIFPALLLSKKFSMT